MDSRVYLGLAGVVDVEAVWDQDVWAALAREYSICRADLHFYGPVRDRREAVRAVLSLIAESRGGEIRVDDPSVSRWLIDSVRHSIALGGTNLRAAEILRQYGIGSVAQVTAADPMMRSLVPEGCELLAAKDVDQLIPNVIIQYPRGALVEIADGTLRSRRADRVILANDENIQHPKFPREMRALLREAKLAMVSSLNAITEFDELRLRVAELSDALRERRADSVFWWEDAGYHRCEYQEVVARAIGPLVDIFSTNIEEAGALTGLQTPIWDPPSVLAVLAALQGAVGTRNVVVHCEGWAAVLGDDADWILPSLVNGQAVSSSRFSKGDGASMVDYEDLLRGGLPMGPRGFASAVESLHSRVRLAPSYDVEGTDSTTLGLGDSFVGGALAQLWSDSVVPPKAGISE